MHEHSTETIDADTDLIFEADTGRWFFRQYREVSPNTTEHRESVSWDDRTDAILALRSGLLTWEEWR